MKVTFFVLSQAKLIQLTDIRVILIFSWQDCDWACFSKCLTITLSNSWMHKNNFCLSSRRTVVTTVQKKEVVKRKFTSPFFFSFCFLLFCLASGLQRWNTPGINLCSDFICSSTGRKQADEGGGWGDCWWKGGVPHRRGGLRGHQGW